MHDNGDDTGATVHRRKRPWVSLILVLCLLVGVGVVFGLVVPRAKAKVAKTQAHPSKPQPLYPQAWDPMIRPLAAVVEKDRGLKFVHPVFVELLTDTQFDKAMSHDSAPATNAERRSVLQTQALLRALGEISDSDNLLEDMRKSSNSDLIGFYSYDDKRVWIRGAALTPATRLTVVHELTHALDDQHFNLGPKMRGLEAANSGAAMAFDAVIEGDARRIEGKYKTTYTKNELIDLPAEANAQLASAQAGDHSFPGLLSAQSIAAYPLGLTAVTRVARRGGNRAVDALFRQPPRHELLITQPWLLGTSWRPHAIPVPKVPAGDAEIGRGEFGALDLYLLLSETVPLPRALLAADAWGGDRYVTYTQNQVSCVRILFAARDQASAKTLGKGVSSWANQRAGTAGAHVHGSMVTLTACSPADAFMQPNDNTYAALQLLVVRNQIEGDMEKDQLGRQLSICLVEALPSRFSARVLQTGKFSNKQLGQLQTMATICRAQG